MFNYVVRRLVIAALTLLFITFLIFALIRNMPGTPLTVAVSEMDPSRRLDPADLERISKTYGLDKPWPQAYVIWLGNTLRGDLGQSFSRKQPVTWIIGERIGPTLLLSLTSIVLAYVLAIPMGLYATARSGKLDERTTSLVLYMLYSLPTFVGGLFLLLLFYQELDWLPLRGMTSDEYDSLSSWGKFCDIAWHAVLPITCFTYTSLAYDARFIRANMAEVIRQDYIRTARAKGVGPFRVLTVHAFRNTLIPLVTQLGLTLPFLLSGSVILEQLFTWPGMGNLFFESIRERDYPTIMGLALLFSVLTLAGQLLADVLYAVVDPRVSYS
ncbi:MAG TPA: ABC transporter permease [Planctomycetaceae bacterium]|nr:ABC transporter permease [Planctomycetaceae bacterium]